MCGRTAQTLGAVQSAAETLRTITTTTMTTTIENDDTNHSSSGRRMVQLGESRNYNSKYAGSENGTEEQQQTQHDNFNLSPGMDAIVFWKDKGKSGKNRTVQCGRKVWGLVPRGGTVTAPLASTGISMHFANLMFNARSDTLWEKATFRSLISAGHSCLVAVDGFFEWKTELGKKQPYFVYNSDSNNNSNDSNSVTTPSGSTGSNNNPRRPYLLLAGLWTRVATGWPAPEPTMLDTFTILTTEVCEPLRWLHSRMPVTIWDTDLATAWLDTPTDAAVYERVVRGAQQTQPHQLQWHAVTPDMASMKFRSEKAIQALPKMKTVKSFFAPATAAATASGNVGKAVSVAESKATSTIKETQPATEAVLTLPCSKKRSASKDALLHNNNSTPKKKATIKTSLSSSTPKGKAMSPPMRSIDSFFKRKDSKD